MKIAVIAHDGKKAEMVAFLNRHMDFLKSVGTEIVATGTTGKHAQDEGENEEHSHDTGSSNHRCVKNLFQTQINRGQNVEHQSEEGAYHHFSLSLFLVSNILEFLSSEAEQQCDSDSYYQEKLHTACYISALAGRASPFTV